MIGTTLDKYEVLQKVGEGGMATVYRGRHATLNRDVAIKVLHPHLSSSQRNRKRFAREARAIEHLHHANILEIFDYSGMEAEDCYIITEFVQGETLTSLLQRRGALPSEVVAILGISLSDALAYAHREGILHRDLKPDNVMVRHDGTVKLMDFGIARFLDESQVTMTGALVGSPAFMSPEQAREQDLDQRSDLFALGTVLFHLVTGHLPFAGSNASLILKNVIEGVRPSVSELAPAMSPRLADVVERLMATHPEDRFNDAGEVAEQLRQCLDDVGIELVSGTWRDDDWSLYAYLANPDGWEARLDAQLKTHLLERGKELLGSGDHLQALRLFNRLLSMDEENEEVLSLVQGLHGEPPSSPRRGVHALSAAALAVLGLAVLGLWWMGRTPTAPPDPVPTVAEAPRPQPAVPVVAPPEPMGAAVEPEPVPVPAPVAVPRERPKPARPALPAPRPREVPEPVAAPAPVVEAPAKLSVRTGELNGDVFIDGVKVGDARQVHYITPGVHDVEIRGLFVESHEERVTASAGEQVVLHVKLTPKPARIHFDAALDERCNALLDGVPAGTLSELDRSLSVPNPHTPHIVSTDCPGEGVRNYTYKYVAREDTFPPR